MDIPAPDLLCVDSNWGSSYLISRLLGLPDRPLFCLQDLREQLNTLLALMVFGLVFVPLDAPPAHNVLCWPGTHPYFCYQNSMLSLFSRPDSGQTFYSSLLNVIRDIQNLYPDSLAPEGYTVTNTSFHIVAFRPSHPNVFPLEILDTICSFLPKPQLLLLRYVSHSWCVGASQYTHSAICLRLRPNWRATFLTKGGDMHDALIFALAVQLAVAFVLRRWSFSVVVTSVCHANWPALYIPFYYNLFTNVRTVDISGSGCPWHYTPVSLPYVLPPTVTSLSISQCTFQGHSVEAMLSRCDSVSYLSLSSVSFGHILGPNDMPEPIPTFMKWRTDFGLETFLKDSIVCPPYGTPPILFELFPCPAYPLGVDKYLRESDIYPLRLRTGSVTKLTLRVSCYTARIVPRICINIGATLTTLILQWPLSWRRAPNTAYFTLSGFTALTKLCVHSRAEEVNIAGNISSTWCSVNWGSPDSAFLLILYFQPRQGKPFEGAVRPFMLAPTIEPSVQNRGIALKGVFGITLVCPDLDETVLPLVHDITTCVDILRMSPLVVVRVDEMKW
ncbi:hypothetical protein EDD18DRAFT_1356033 [Armillaria luteobubalina]|uniref:F-box domain-containing protein n=1 Tax=Armillaria luteobubalina TaxID=153913 RepID=A0AA39Q0N8_9AGAR|nr:hypothetical protein EDD18DRAFT_1356033 [Armillaria luteobubalina]